MLHYTPQHVSSYTLLILKSLCYDERSEKHQIMYSQFMMHGQKNITLNVVWGNNR